MSKLTVITILSLVLAISPSAAISESRDLEVLEPRAQCVVLLRECFANSEAKRSNCFYSSAKHPFCEGTTLGKLSMKRWQMSPNKPAQAEAPAFLGPQLTDQECLAKFDNMLSTELSGKKLSEEMMARFEKELGQCTKQISMELLRP